MRPLLRLRGRAGVGAVRNEPVGSASRIPTHAWLRPVHEPFLPRAQAPKTRPQAFLPCAQVFFPCAQASPTLRASLGASRASPGVLRASLMCLARESFLLARKLRSVARKPLVLRAQASPALRARQKGLRLGSGSLRARKIASRLATGGAVRRTQRVGERPGTIRPGATEDAGRQTAVAPRAGGRPPGPDSMLWPHRAHSAESPAAVPPYVSYRKPARDGWHWSPSDFLVMGVLVFCAGLTYEVLAARFTRRNNGSRWALASFLPSPPSGSNSRSKESASWPATCSGSKQPGG